MSSLDPISGPLGRSNAKHLLKRATFGPTQQEINSFAQLTVVEAVDMLFQPQAEPQPPVDPATGENWVSPLPGPENSEESVLARYFIAWHLELMRNEQTNVREKIVWFLHAHLPVSVFKVEWSAPIYYQNKLYRHFAFGSFKNLFKKLLLDNAMLWYLDNTLNEAENPNENFAREMLELYTIGKGPQIGPGDYTHYTEEDVKAAAKVLTGLKVDITLENYDPDLLPETKIAQGYVYTYGEDLAILHDPGIKTFSEKFQHTQIQPNEIVSGFATKNAVLDELDQLIEMIFAQEETARFLVRKLYRFFVFYNITEEIEQDIIQPLAQTFISSNFSIKAVLEQLFKSQHFYDADNSQTSDDHKGAIIQSPVDLMNGAFRFFNIPFPTDVGRLYEELYSQQLLNFYYIMGIPIYFPEDVAGYPAYFQAPGYNRNWITSTNQACRYYLIYALLFGIKNENDEILIQLDIIDWVEKSENISDPSDPEILVIELIEGLLAANLPQERLEYFTNIALMDNLPLYYWTVEWNNYQNGSSDDLVRNALHRLLISLMQSPESQLF